MPGALTANAIAANYAEVGTIDEDELIIATIAFLSPVEGANNVLLTSIVTYGVNDDSTELTFQWYRAAPAASIASTVLGDAVGDPFTIDAPDGNGADTQISVNAIDRGAGLASGYALTAIADGDGIAAFIAGYVDAVLYD